ncbi:hypothetical protein [Mucilaginibacter lacusdianchii]|uniref:hypothetical protein n=1 Tax=Mucilaginibacter lacusdianchii TaxID=2684211 RepID=UPI00131A629F|nr:hypothetical protein [Mucilaginibacter sp. JXJ CY 39]
MASNLDGKSLNFLVNSGKLLTGWNWSKGAGETDFIANQGAGNMGGFAFYNYNNSNQETRLMYIRGDGKVGFGVDDP